MVWLSAVQALYAQSYEDVFDVQFRPGWRADDGTHIAGLAIRMKPGWKTYWRHPGDVGVPPHINWHNSRNIASVKVLWPTPKVSYKYGLRSIGYYDEVVFPLVITPLNTQDPVLNVEFSFGICKDICIPETVEFSQTLNANTPLDSSIKAAIAQQPERRTQAMQCRFEHTEGALKVSVSFEQSEGQSIDEVAIELADSSIWVSTPLVERAGDKVIATSQVILPETKGFAIARNEVTATYLNGAASVEYIGCKV